MLPTMTAKDVAKMKKEVLARRLSEDPSNLPDESKHDIVATQNKLSSLFYISHLIRKQGEFLIMAGMIALIASAGALYKKNADLGLGLSILGAPALLAGGYKRRKGLTAERALAKALSAKYYDETPSMTGKELKVIKSVSSSFTAILATAFQPIYTVSTDPMLIQNKGRWLWEKKYLFRQYPDT